MHKIAIVGSANVGKSVMFNNLTGSYVAVSNYPGTTVEVCRGSARIGGQDFEIIDTPGMYSFLAMSEDEKVARRILLTEEPCLILHMIEAKNLGLRLPLTLQLLEAGLAVILVLNMMDEARSSGINIDVMRLEKELNIPVVATVSTTQEGLDVLRGRIEEYVKRVSA